MFDLRGRVIAGMVVVVVGVVMAVVAVALGAAPAAGGTDQPCKADIEKFCKAEEPGGGRVERCLRKHDSDLSAACRATVAKVEEEIEACRDDVAKICWAEKPENGGIRKCLKKHRADLSGDCKSALDEKKKKSP